MAQRSHHPFTLATLLLMAMTLTFVGAAYSGEKNEEKGKADMAVAAKVTIDQAIKTASDKVSGKVVEAELEKKHGKLVWEVEVVTAENKVMEVHIDAETGAVIDTEEKKTESKPAHKQERKREHKN